MRCGGTVTEVEGWVDYLAVLPNIQLISYQRMTTKTQERLKAQAMVLKALAHPTRLLLVEELARKTRCVCELRDAAGLDISTVSKHLSLLRNAGIVEDEKRGLKVFYSLRTPCVLNFFKCVESVQKCSK
jgi:DNA-binding transcriptional ArsR family regulator